MDTSDNHSGAVEWYEAAGEERDRRAGHYKAASGSPEELPAFTELQAAEAPASRTGSLAHLGRAGPLGHSRGTPK